MKTGLIFPLLLICSLAFGQNAFEGNNCDDKALMGGPRCVSPAPQPSGQIQANSYSSIVAQCANVAVAWMMNPPRQYGPSANDFEVVVKQTRKNIFAGKSPWYGSRAYENGNGDLISILTFGDDEGLGSSSRLVRLSFNAGPVASADVATDEVCQLVDAEVSIKLEM